MADNTEFRQNLIREWRAALDAVRRAGAVTIAVGVTDMAIILDAADPDGGKS
jgi:hypothetical protein